MDWCGLTAWRYPGFSCVVTASSMSRMTSPTRTFMLYFVRNSSFALRVQDYRQHHIHWFIDHIWMWSGGLHICTARTTLAHTLMNNPCWQFGYWNPETADTYRNRFTNFFQTRYVVTNTNLAVYISGDAGAITMSSSESDFDMVISLGPYMEGKTLMGWTGFAISICDPSGNALGAGGTIWLSAWGSAESSLIWLRAGWDIIRGICDCSGMISWACLSSPNMVVDGVLAVVSVWGFPTAGTWNSVILYFIRLSRN